jgi:dipeptidyl aminopeptidase/acylaminoacyl peptidase
MIRQIRILIVLALVLGFVFGLGAQKHFDLTIDNIMRGPQLYGYEPGAARWSGDSSRVFFQWKRASDPPLKPLDTYVVNRDGSGLRKLSEEEAKLAPPLQGDRTRDRKRIVYAQDGDIFVYDYSNDRARQLTKTVEIESNPHFTHDEKRVAFTRGNNLYVLSLDSGSIEQMTDIRPPGAVVAGDVRDDKKDDKKKGTDSQEFLKKQEKELLESVRERALNREEREARQKRENPRKPLQLEARQTVTRLELCPDEKCVIAIVTEGANGSKPDNVPNFVTESAYVEEITGRTNVGDTQGRSKAAILDAVSGEVKWVETGLGDREVQVQAPVFNAQGSRAVMTARALDNKDRWFLSLDTATGKTSTIYTEHDDAWLDGPGPQAPRWMKAGESLYFTSERSGYSHLYRVSAAGGDPQALTSGKFEVSAVELSNDGGRFYIISSQAGSGERRLYSMSSRGGECTEITTISGSHRVFLSPDEKYLADIYSYTNEPPELYAMDNRPGASAKKLTDSPAPEFWDYSWLDVPIVEVPSRDGTKIPAHFYKPVNYRGGGPAVIFVHGAGYLQNVHKYWSSNYSHEYLFHHYLMEHGYMVLDLDYRGSAGYGRDWRTAIYRHMGGKDLDDNVDGAKWLVEQGADPKRIGIYGGSYGGFITLMGMFTTPDVFAAGAALRPVTDWAHYNNGYTSNILNTPQKDEEAYRQSSPIYFAQNLKGALLICHGMVDTNVFFQDSARLVQRLIELRKENWSVAIYPVEDHGFQQASSWADEYKRIFNLFETNLKKGL